MDENILIKLCSKAKLDRDKGFQDLELFLSTADIDVISATEQKIADILSQSNAEWESKHGALMGAKAIIQTGKAGDDFSNGLIQKALELADDGEFRVRIAAGKIWVRMEANFLQKIHCFLYISYQK